MEYAIKTRRLTKSYPEFKLDNVNFELPGGSIMGLIGDNGAGKTTFIKLLLNLIGRDEGEILVLEKDPIKCEREIKSQIGVVFDECCWSEMLSPTDINRILQSIYPTWNEQHYYSFIDRFSLPRTKKIKEFSRGMKMKLSIAAALGHSPKLLILDEATGGLDPIVRNEILDIFMDFICDEEHSILMCSHITSDLEKVCDYISFLHNGKLILSMQKDEMLSSHAILRCDEKTLRQLPNKTVERVIKRQFGCDALINDAQHFKAKNPELTVDFATLEDMMMFYAKGETL